MRNLRTGVPSPQSGGFTLVEVLVGLGLLGVSLAIGIRYFDQHKKRAALNQMRIAMFSAVRTIENVLDNTGTLAVSANRPGNQALKECLPDQYEACTNADVEGECRKRTAVSCRDTAATSWQPFTLYHPEDTNLRLAGPTGSPAGFDKFGRACSTPPCAFNVETSFQSRCFPGQVRCEAAQMLIVPLSDHPE